MLFWIISVWILIFLIFVVAAGRVIYIKIRALKEKKKHDRYYGTENEIEAQRIEYEKWSSGVAEEHKKVLQHYHDVYDNTQQSFLRGNYENKGSTSNIAAEEQLEELDAKPDVITERKGSVPKVEDGEIPKISYTPDCYVGKKVVHKAFGEGVLIEYLVDRVKIQFSDETRIFLFPDSYDEYYVFDDQWIHEVALRQYRTTGK